MSPTLARIFAPGVLVVRMVWFALTVSIPLYVLIARLVVAGAPDAIPLPALLATFVTLALGLAVAALVLPRVFPSDALLGGLVSQDHPPEAITLALSPGHVDVNLMQQVDGTERRLVMVAPLFRTQAILRAALAEGIGVLGFVLAVVSRSFPYVIPFAALAIVVQLLVFPRIEPLVERARPLVRG